MIPHAVGMLAREQSVGGDSMVWNQNVSNIHYIGITWH